MAGVNDGHVAASESVLMQVLLVFGGDIHRDPPRCKGIEFDPMPGAIRSLSG
jgi:hypothetical protein